MTNNHERTYNLYDIEEQILKCWEIGEDLVLVAQEHEDNDEISNKVMGLKHVYDMRFNKLWWLYEQAIKLNFADRKADDEATTSD